MLLESLFYLVFKKGAWKKALMDLCHTVSYLFKRLKFISHQLNSENNGLVLLCTTLYEGTETVCCHLRQQMARMEVDNLKLEKVRPTFSSLNALPAKITNKTVVVDAS